MLNHVVFTTLMADKANSFHAALSAWGIASNVCFCIALHRDEYQVLVAKRDVRSAQRILNSGRYGVIRVA